ncbi:rRNA methyltransferase [Chlorella sorokiniana]|uniref:rRNA methyltransferase n=1 Tax=Chlorella sorokiniana TaxID=3076 RepID=A0A2P6TE02_CHLSO|nr:rRNA methyltransferase [Chlorella sorokiniana]|eukprot:PRW20859.1 rRNA methyltransferase [Chlorella sorokiniana]
MLSQSALARRLEERVAEDARLRTIEATKKDAVARRVDVDTFQALVSAAHLRPMRGGLRLAPGAAAGKSPAPRSFRPEGTLASGDSSSLPLSTVPAAHNPTPNDGALRSGALFVRAWRAAAPTSRAELLRRAVAAGALPRLLRLELSSRLLEELLDCLGDAEDAPAVAGAAAATGKCAHRGAAAGGDCSSPAAEPNHHELAWAVLQAAAAASSYAVAEAGLSLQARQRLAGLRAALQ